MANGACEKRSGDLALDQIVHCASLHRFHVDLRAVLPSEQNERARMGLAARIPDELEAGILSEILIDQIRVMGLLTYGFQGLAAFTVPVELKPGTK